MTSPARLAANRSNALHSTGPRTAAGKLASSRNATRHGILAQPLLPSEDPTEYDALASRVRLATGPRYVAVAMFVDGDEAAVARGLLQAPIMLDHVVEGQTARALRGAALRMMVEESDLPGWWRAEAMHIADAFDPHHREFEPDVMEAARKDTENWLREFVLSRDEAPHGRYESEDETND